ncbi:MAG: cation:proton antiporter [Puniceicoccales bacterium]|jgi:CPA2 family monovalent cation:H+ antiporter-2|nr:cation:proton antiporter [Puniceicoccales bacterium]
MAIVLLAAGIAGVLCKLAGLSVIVGYLLAGIVIGPNTPLRMLTDQTRIEDLAQVGLVFVMFAIGLNLSLTKLARMGVATLAATALGAALVFVFTLLLGQAMGWNYKQGLFLAAMLMVSSSAVIAKLIQEAHLSHNKTAQLALSITVCEDIVAVVMLAILASVGGVVGTGDAASTGAAIGAAVMPTGGVNAVMEVVGNTVAAAGTAVAESALVKIGRYVVLILALCILILPRVLKRLDTSGDPELRTIVIAGLLLILAVCAAQAGFSIALGAFLFGAIVGEMPQRDYIERSFESVRSIFSSLFFVSIGMMAKPAALLDPRALVLTGALLLFAMVGRPLACGFALVLVGVAPREARRGGLLLTPLGEFTFIIAQAAIAASLFEDYLYPVAIALSLCTVLLTPFTNRYAKQITEFAERMEPRVVTKTLDAYHEWFLQMKNTSPSQSAWRLTRPRLLQIGIEMLLVTAISAFAPPVSSGIASVVKKVAHEGGAILPQEGEYAMVLVALAVFWVVVGIVVAMILVSICRSANKVILIFARSFSASNGWNKEQNLPRNLLERAFQAASALAGLFWIYSILPSQWRDETLRGVTLPMRIVLLAGAAAVLGLFSRKLIQWHEAWQGAVADVLSGSSSAETKANEVARHEIGHGLESWDIHLQNCVLPENAACAGESLSDLAIPTRFGGTVSEIERNGYCIHSPGPETRLYPGDKVFLLGKEGEIASARAFLMKKGALQSDVSARVVLETCTVDASSRAGKSFAELGVARQTGVRIVAIQRGTRRIINPKGDETLENGDALLLAGTIEQTRAFAKWLKTVPPDAQAPLPAGAS